jgi:2-C-methyl-D-erythritol 2,4-cyclodiphosphate synthase
MIRIGSGFDVHALAEGRRLVLGGIEIDYPQGLAGHSDADVVLHALCDAMLGAVANYDVGHHFPPGKPEYKDIDSLKLLEKVDLLLREDEWSVVNADITVICEKPRLAPFIDKMRARISTTLKVNIGQISIKATTSEKLGSMGREEGIAAMAVVLVEK